jgi:hypothetical protein
VFWVIELLAASVYVIGAKRRHLQTNHNCEPQRAYIVVLFWADLSKLYARAAAFEALTIHNVSKSATSMLVAHSWQRSANARIAFCNSRQHDHKDQFF